MLNTSIDSKYITGFAIGVGVSALAFYAYKKNQNSVDEFLRKQGINVKKQPSYDSSSMSLEELVLQKENLEDLIAEKEMNEKNLSVAEASEPTNETLVTE